MFSYSASKVNPPRGDSFCFLGGETQVYSRRERHPPSRTGPEERVFLQKYERRGKKRGCDGRVDSMAPRRGKDETPPVRSIV